MTVYVVTLTSVSDSGHVDTSVRKVFTSKSWARIFAEHATATHPFVDMPGYKISARVTEIEVERTL